jgi:hypothetical protein
MPAGDADALREELHADPPAGLIAILGSEDLEALTDAVRVAKVRQREALDQAAEDALSHLPGLLRRAIARVLR